MSNVFVPERVDVVYFKGVLVNLEVHRASGCVFVHAGRDASALDFTIAGLAEDDTVEVVTLGKLGSVRARMYQRYLWRGEKFQRAATLQFKFGEGGS